MVVDDAQRAVLKVESELAIVAEARKGTSERITLQGVELSNLTMQRDAASKKLFESEQRASQLARTAARASEQVGLPHSLHVCVYHATWIEASSNRSEENRHS